MLRRVKGRLALQSAAMCGRYALKILALEGWREYVDLTPVLNFPDSYNVAPTQPVPIVRMVDGKREFALVRWGLIPPWVKDPRAFSLVIHARGESVNDKPAFKNAMKRRRCLFPADGFYEWRVEGSYKRPFYVRRRGGGPLAFAGVWEVWSGPNGEEVETAALITTPANRSLSDIHHRMPVVLAPDAFDFWLDPAIDGETAAALIAAAPDDVLEAVEVSSAVNRVANDTADLTEPVTEPGLPPPVPVRSERASRASKDDGQASLF
jgi:putative SOS response-associated peptidase YedK